MKFLLLITLIFVGCHNKNELTERQSGQETAYMTNDTIPEIRTRVNKNPVASYMVPINNPLLHQFFGVKVYESHLTFHYVLRMQYEGMIETDTLKIPNFGIWPVVEVRPTKERLSCIIGFRDKEKNFREYKLLNAKGDKLKLKTLHHYAVGGYRTEY